jgi:gamma-glutamyltranspeptidase/glutathione hydrolase
VVSPAENLARFGQVTSRALARDLAADGNALMNDRAALSAFMTPRRQMLQAGDALKQMDLSIVLSRLRSRGGGDFYTGGLGRDVEDAISLAGGTITAQDLRAYVPRWIQAAGVDESGTRLFALPEGYGGGHFMAAYKNPVPASEGAPSAGSTGFVVADAAGGAVACSISMGRPFGLGLMPKGTGFLLAPAPDAPGVSAKVLAPVMGINIATNRIVFAAAAAGEGAIRDVAAVTRAVVAENRAVNDVAENLPKTPGKRATLINMLACTRTDESAPACVVRNDPRGDGYALILAPKD